MTDMAQAPYKVVRSTRASKIGSVIGLVLFIVLVSFPTWGDRATIRLLVEIF
jgi:hypothetical protein